METGDSATVRFVEWKGDRPPSKTNQQANEVSNSKMSSLVNAEKNESPLSSDTDSDNNDFPSKLSVEELNNQTAMKPQPKSSFSICSGDLKKTQRNAVRRAGKEVSACATEHSKSDLGLQSESTSEIAPTYTRNTVDSTNDSLSSLLSTTTKTDLDNPSQQFSSAEKEITLEEGPSLQAAGTPEQGTMFSSLAGQVVSPSAASKPPKAQNNVGNSECCRWVGHSRHGSNVLHFNKAYLRVMPSSRCQFTPVEVQSFLQTQHAVRRCRHYDQPSRVMHDFNMCTPHLPGPRRVLSQTRGMKGVPYFTTTPSEEDLNRSSGQLLSTHCLGPSRGRSKIVRRKGLGIGAVEILLNHNSPAKPRPKGRRLIGPLAEHICAFQENRQ